MNTFIGKSSATLLFLFSMLLTTIAWAGPTVLLTGGTGYIGSHIAVVLLQSGHEVILLDNLANSESDVVGRIEKASNKTVKAFYAYDLLDEMKLNSVFEENKIDAVVHLAGFKAVGESVEKPLKYYSNNLISTLNLLHAMSNNGCHKLVFSSSATVYGTPQYLPLDEKHPTSATNPYGQTKLMIEKILEDTAKADSKNQFISLRYFNPIGAHESALLGENPKGIPQNLLPYMLQVVQGKRPHLNIYGDDYDTKDGTGVRDYIHVTDLAEGHLNAISFLFNNPRTGHEIYNLGTGSGYSVLEMLNALSEALGKDIPYVVSSRRPGDVGSVYANPKKAEEELGFKAKKTLQEMMQDSLAWSNTLDARADKSEL